jgi:hypothetical protein
MLVEGGGLDQWFIETLGMLEQNGWRCVPVFEGGGTLPYGDGQTYYCPTHYLGRAVAIGVVLRDALLLDYDANKPEALGKIISLEALGYELNADLATPVQANKAGNSLHYLWRWREGFEPQRASCDGWKPYIDLKCGNQLMHLKPGKILTDGELPPVGELPVAGGVLEEAFNGGYRRDKGSAVAGDVIGRNSTLTSFVGSLIHEGVPVREVSARAMAKNQEFYEPLDEAEVLKVVKSVVSSDVSKPENVASWGAMVEERDRSAMDDYIASSALPDDFLEPVAWVVDEFIQDGCMVIPGARGVGKTTALIPLCSAVCGALGVEGLEIKVTRHVCYFAEDVGQVYRALQGVMDSGGNGVLLRERLHVFEAKRQNVEAYRDLVARLREQFSIEVGGERVEPLFVMDTARACFSVESENDNTDISNLIMSWRLYCGTAPSWIVTHVTKAQRDTDVSELSSAGADAFESDTQGMIGLGMMTRTGGPERVLWAGAGMKRRNQGLIEGLVISSETRSQERDAGLWGVQDVSYMIITMEVLRRGERAQRLSEAAEQKKAIEQMMANESYRKGIRECIANCEHLRKCDPSDEGGYATKQVIYDALGVGRGRASKNISDLLESMVASGELVPRPFSDARSEGVKKRGDIGEFYILAPSVGR